MRLIAIREPPIITGFVNAGGQLSFLQTHTQASLDNTIGFRSEMRTGFQTPFVSGDDGCSER